MSSEDCFWRWFLEHEEELWALHSDEAGSRDALFERLETELQKVNEQLTFEFGSGPERRDFVVSADGFRGAFPAVLRLTQAAPELSRWNVIAFRPRRGEHGSIEMDGTILRGDELTFTLLDDGRHAGLKMFIPGYTEDKPAMKGIAYLFLDEALGEYDVETGLTLLEFHAPEDLTQGDRHPMSELPERFDQLVSRLRGMSGRSN